jgi:hypothetical protein
MPEARISNPDPFLSQGIPAFFPVEIFFMRFYTKYLLPKMDSMFLPGWKPATFNYRGTAVFAK